jgi:hypothetical protein
MKNLLTPIVRAKIFLCRAVCAAGLLAGVPNAFAQYSLNWFSVDGSGGTSTGGVYSVSGAVARPDSGRLSGGTYTVDGGAWALVAAVQTPGAPLLSIRLTSTNTIIISWPAPSNGFVLQDNSALDSTNWNNVTASPTSADGKNQLIIPAQTGQKFYRLRTQ